MLLICIGAVIGAAICEAVHYAVIRRRLRRLYNDAALRNLDNILTLLRG